MMRWCRFRAIFVFAGSLFALGANAGLLTANISGVPTVVPVSPVSGAPSQVVPSFTVAYSGTVGEPSPATGTVLAVSFNSSDLTYVSANGSGWSCTPSVAVVLCNGPDIPLNLNSIVTLTFSVRGGGGSNTSQLIATPSASTAGGPVPATSSQQNFEITNRVDFSLSGGGNFAINQGSTQALNFVVARNTLDSNAPANLWEGLRVNLVFPSEIRYQGASASGWNCSGASVTPGGTFQCVRSTNTPSASPESIVVQALGQTVTGTPVQVSGQVQQNSPEPNQNNNSSASSLTVVAVNADVSVTGQVVGAAVNGQNFTIRLTGNNAGPAAATGVAIDFASASGLQLTLPAGCSSVSPGLSRCLIGNLAASASQSFDLVARHINVQPAGGVLNNSASISADQLDPNGSNNSAPVPVSLQGAADLEVQLVDSPDPVLIGAEFGLTVDVKNNGPDTAQSVSVNVSVSAGAEFIGFGTPAGGGGLLTCSSGSLPNSYSCGIASLAAAGTARALIRLRAPLNASSLSSTASVSSGGTTSDPLATNNSDTEITGVTGAASLTFSKRSSSPEVTVGTDFTYFLTVRNSGSIEQTGLVVQDNIPSGQTPLSAQGAGFNCSISAQLVDCRGLSLAVGSSAEIAIATRAPAVAGSVSNNATALSVQNSTPALASTAVQFVAAAEVNLLLDKRDSQDPVLPNGVFDYQLAVSNRGAQTVTSFSVSDTLPAGITVLGFSGANWSCSGLAAPVLTCDFNGSLLPGADAVVNLSVRAPAQAGVLLNRASLAGIPGESNLADNVDQENTTVQPSVAVNVDLELTGALSASGSVSAGQDVPFTLTARNLNSSTAANDVTLCGSAVPSGAAFRVISLSASGVNCNVPADGSSISCQIPSLGGGQSLSFSGLARVGSASANSSIGLDAQIGCNRIDPVPSNNNVSLRATVGVAAAPGADLSVSLVDSVDPVASAARFDYIAEVRNVGLSPANAPVLNFALGSSFTYRGFTGAGWACVGNGVTASCQAQAALAAQAISSVRITVEATGTLGTFESVVTVASTTADPVAVNNRATQSTTIGATDDPDAIEDQLAPAVVNDPFAGAAAPVVADICANPVAELAPQCRALIDAALSGNNSGVADGLRALFPEEVIAQSVSLTQAAATQFSNVDARLNELRGGSGGFSVSGLALGLGRQALPLGVLRGLLGDEDEEPAIGESGDLISRWGGFVNGTLSRGEQDVGRDSRRVVADFHSYGLTAGVDYRRSTRLVVGAAIGYADFESDIQEGGSLATKGFTLTGYTSWYPRDMIYLDARLSYALLDLDLQRRINFSTANFTLDRTAQGSTDSDQLTFAASTGYHFSRGSWSVTPNLGLRYVKSQVDGFTETGAGANSAIYSDQDIDSLQLSLGMQVTRVISLSNGVITPQFDFSFGREMRGDDLVIEARLVGAAADQVFRVEAEDADQSFGNVGLGVVYIAPNGRQFYVSYRELLGVEGLDRGSLTLGGRFEF